MKEVKRETKREVIDTIIEYYACDGTVFDSKEECEKYEKTSACFINFKANNCKVSEGNSAWNLMGGYEDNEVVAFKPECESDVESLCQLLILHCPWLNDDDCKENRDKKFQIINDVWVSGDVVLFGKNCEGDYYFINSRQNIIDNLMKLDKEELDNVK